MAIDNQFFTVEGIKSIGDIIVPSSNVGIGTTNPEGNVLTGNTSKLHVGVVTANYYYGDGQHLTGISGGSGINAAGTTGAIQFKASGGGLSGDVELFGIDVTNQRIGIGTDPTDTNNFITASGLEVPLIIKAKDSGGAAGSASAIQFIQSDGEEDFSRFTFANNDLTAAAEILAIHNTHSVADSQNNLIFRVYGSSTESLNFRSSATSKAFYPGNDDTIDLGISGSNEFKNIYFTGSLYQNGTEFTGGIGAGDITVSFDSYTCDLPIRITENAGTADIGIGTTSNAHGRRFISTETPDPNIAYCDGDVWYQPETITGDAIQVIQGAWNGVPYANANPISVDGAVIGIGTTSNAHGRRYIESGPPTATDGTLGDVWYDISGGSVGQATLAVTNTGSSSYTLSLSDLGSIVRMTSLLSTATVNVPLDVFSPGHTIMISNSNSIDIQITPASGVTLRVPGTSLTGGRTLVQYGFVTMICMSSNNFLIMGSGLS